MDINATLIGESPVAAYDGMYGWLTLTLHPLPYRFLIPSFADAQLHRRVRVQSAWYQWNPASYTIFNSITFSAGDTVYLNITLTNSTFSTITVKNLNTNCTVTQDVSSTYELCQTDAEWSVSDYNDDLGPEVVYVDYGSVTFEKVRANIVMEGGEEESVGTDGARVVLQKRGDEMLTKVETTESSVSVIYGEKGEREEE